MKCDALEIREMKESPIFSRTYDMLLWLLPQATRFPRVHRFGLGERVIRRALDFQEALIAVCLQSGSERKTLLKQADTQLAQLRQILRLCKDLQLFSLGQYEHIAKMLVEIGRLLGGWMKSVQ
ncbi:MAG: diversity-generating retroelement protein Avd [Chloroflexota bacterium]